MVNSVDGSRLLGRRTKYTEVSERGMCEDRAYDAEGSPLESWGGGRFFGGSVVKKPPANAGDTGLTPNQERSHMPRGN